MSNQSNDKPRIEPASSDDNSSNEEAPNEVPMEIPYEDRGEEGVITRSSRESRPAPRLPRGSFWNSFRMRW